jgi:hypothetical protein
VATTSQSTIYISVSNPLDEPAFRPRPTKPIPQWMQLPTNPEAQSRVPISVPKRFCGNRTTTVESNSSGASTICPSKTLSSPTPTPPPRKFQESPGSPGPLRESIPRNTPNVEPRRQQTISFVSSEPLKLPSSCISGGRRRKSQTASSSSYMTPPEYPTLIESQSSIRSSTPSSARWRRKEDSFDSEFVPQASLNASVKPKPALRKHELARTSPALSSEYLERYRPVKTPSARKSSTAEPMIDMIRRNSRAEASMARVVEETVTARGSINLDNETDNPPDSARFVGRRQHLQSELKKLFGGR